MSKLYLDDVNIKNYVIPNLDDAIKYLNYAIYECRGMIIPEDFEFKQYLRNLGNDISNTLSSLENKRGILKNTINTYKNIEKTRENAFADISISKVPYRRNTIK